MLFDLLQLGAMVGRIAYQQTDEYKEEKRKKEAYLNSMHPDRRREWQYCEVLRRSEYYW